MYERLESIASTEECVFEDDQTTVLNAILHISNGDMRRAIMTLQSAHALGNGIQTKHIAEIAGTPESIDDLIDGLCDGSFDKMEQSVNNLVAEGYSATVVLNALLEQFVLAEDGKLDDDDKALISMKMAEADKCLVDGADDLLQLLSVCSIASKCIMRKKQKRPS